MLKNGVYYVISKDSKDALDPLQAFLEVSIKGRARIFMWYVDKEEDYLELANIYACKPNILEIINLD